jgi:hypothetical protein
MPAFELRLRIPFGDAGHVCLDIDIDDLSQLTPEQRKALADTSRDFFEFAMATLSGTPGLLLPAAQVHDPNPAVLAGVTGSRANTS